jgi:hypothetical protein
VQCGHLADININLAEITHAYQVNSILYNIIYYYSTPILFIWLVPALLYYYYHHSGDEKGAKGEGEKKEEGKRREKREGWGEEGRERSSAGVDALCQPQVSPPARVARSEG